MQLVLIHGVGGIQIHQHHVGIVARLQLALGKAQNFCRAGAHQVHQHFQRQAFLLAELGVADAESGLAAHHTGHALELVLFGVGRVVGCNGIHDAGADAVHQRLHIVGGADGRVHTVIAGIIGEPQVMRGHLTGDGCTPQLCHLDGIQRTAGGHVAHVQLGLVVFAQPAVAHRLDVLSQTVVPRADLHILGVAHHGDILLGADGESLCHGGIVLHAVAVLGDELHTGRQGLEVVDAHTVKVLGDGDGLVHIAQAYFGSLLLHHERLCRRRAHRLCVGHQVHEGVTAGGCGAAAGLDVLLVLKARGAPVAVQVHKGGQHGQPAGINDRFVLPGQCLQLLTHSSDPAVLYKNLKRSSFGVHSIYKQHRSSLLICVCLVRLSGLRAKKNFSPQREKLIPQKKETTNPRQNRMRTACSVWCTSRFSAWCCLLL